MKMGWVFHVIGRAAALPWVRSDGHGVGQRHTKGGRSYPSTRHLCDLSWRGGREGSCFCNLLLDSLPRRWTNTAIGHRSPGLRSWPSIWPMGSRKHRCLPGLPVPIPPWEAQEGWAPAPGQYGTGVSSTGTQLVRRYTSQVVIVVGDLPQSRAAGSLVELWRGETMSTGDNDLPALMPLLVEANFRHFGETTSTPVQHTFGEEEIRRLRGSK